MSNPTKPFPLPTSYFSIVLGLSAFAMAWKHAAHLFPTFSAIISPLLGSIATGLWCLFFIAYGVKWLKFPEQAKAEFHHPIQFSFISLIPISAMTVSEFLLGYVPQFASALIFIAIFAQLLFAASRVGGLWRGDEYCEKAILPPFYLPSVAANFTSASALGLLGYQDIGYLFWGAGLLSWLSFEPIILQRLRVATLDAPLRGTMGIILAPAFVASAAYLVLNGGEIDLLVKILWGYGLLQLLFLVRLLPWLWVNAFTIGFWAFSFGLASIVNSAASVIHVQPHSALATLAMTLFVLANLAFIGIIFGTLVRIVQGRFLLKSS